MTTDSYNKMAASIKKNKILLNTIVLLNNLLTYVCYVIYPVLIVILLISHQKQLMLRCLLVPGISFIIVSVFRRFVNFKRPYEELDIEPLIYKATTGNSFPSRHVFSAFIIAMCWLNYVPVVAVILFFVGVIMAIVRVICGVHYPKDVICGALIGIIAGIIGFYII